MSKPSKTEAELIVMAREKLQVHLDCPNGIVISVLRTGDSGNSGPPLTRRRSSNQLIPNASR